MRSKAGAAEKLSVVTAVIGVALFALGIASDFIFRTFWARHAMLTSLLANVLVVVITVAVVNKVIERRNRRRWALVAQNALFALVQSARLTWTTMLEVLQLGQVQTGTTDSLREGAEIALDRSCVSAATRDLLASPDRRRRLQSAAERLGDHAGDVIGRWAAVMVGAATYAYVLDRHVELQGRLEWLSSVLANTAPAPDDQTVISRRYRTSVASEQADQFDDDSIHDVVLSIVVLATRLDSQSRELAFSLVSAAWWSDRTQELIEA
jgi:hypothetical protein